MPELHRIASDLYEILLGPVADHIAAAKQLLILPDGPLYYLPWSALRRPTSKGDTQYLVEYRPLHVAVSATVFAELKRGRKPTEQDQVRVTAFGDPTYPVSSDVAQLHQDTLVRRVGERGIFDWRRLPSSRREVEAVSALYPNTAKVYLGEAATEEVAKHLDRDIDIIHFATHGHVDERFPMNSFLALSIPEVLEEGRDNGLLQVWEIYERLRVDAELVVLSACQTGIGEELRGEGIMGLTRAFHYAGARSVLSTLWSVDDLAASELMIRFHRHLRAGLTKDEALREAQVELIRAPIEIEGGKQLDAAAPRAWAGFQLYGDWM